MYKLPWHPEFLSDLNKKTTFSVPPACGCFMPNIKSFGHTASVEMSFEIVDDGRRTDDGYLPIL